MGDGWHWFWFVLFMFTLGKCDEFEKQVKERDATIRVMKAKPLIETRDVRGLKDFMGDAREAWIPSR